jgi:hypothetical protein
MTYKIKLKRSNTFNYVSDDFIGDMSSQEFFDFNLTLESITHIKGGAK